ncbi:unnamed protein product [Brassica oleracea]
MHTSSIHGVYASQSVSYGRNFYVGNYNADFVVVIIYST